MTDAPAWRLLVDAAGDGAWNMAVDEALLETYVRPDPPAGPTLRLYGFAPPALSLGRNQTAPGIRGCERLRRSGVTLVRRPTGGSAVLHDRERTYAIAGRLGRAPFDGGVIATYHRIAMAMTAALEGLHIPARIHAAAVPPPRRSTAACFARLSRNEISVGGRKLVGAAQLRRRGAFVQHGSLPVSADRGLLQAVLDERVPASAVTDLESELGRVPGMHEIDEAIVEAFRAIFRTELVPAELDVQELQRAERLRETKYARSAWTERVRLSAPSSRSSAVPA